MKTEKKSFWKKKGVTASFGFLALAGSFFLFDGSMTGNTIVSENITEITKVLPIIGIALFICSVVLIVYSLKR